MKPKHNPAQTLEFFSGKTAMNAMICILLFSHAFLSCQQPTERVEVEQWGVYEIELLGPKDGNPYMEVELSAVFQSQNGESPTVLGFYDGKGAYRIRFSPPSQGEWTYRTYSNAAELEGKEGEFISTAPSKDNHGPLRIFNTFYLQYADGSPYYGIGTTAYQWTSVKQSIQEKTLETLAGSPFNKIRMCVFPKHYQYGNEIEPWAYPYKREGEENDFTQPNFEFFRNFDKRVKQLMDMGVQADVILFHPYDSWGYAAMGAEMNEKYVRYMIARLSAYRNVWWSLANEWDIPSIKEAIDWEGIGTLLQQEDPHQRLRGIHNWYSSEDHFYDHTKPWITHVSTQTDEFFNAKRWRDIYQKPLLFDEMRYEGDVPTGWGNLTGEQMAAYFWMAGLSGGYPTHGDTFDNDSDDGEEVRWWSKGGTLMGSSPERIAYFKSVMETLPVHEMQPKLIPAEDPKNRMKNQYLFSKPGEVYLVYVGDEDQTASLELPGNTPYNLQVMDTWKMEVIGEKKVDPGTFNFTTKLPYTALKIYK